MRDKDKELLVFVLSRSGCLDYTREMLAHYKGARPTVFVSAFAVENMPGPVIPVPTFRNPFELIWNTMWIPVWLGFQIWKAHQRGCLTAWFPVFHPWNPFLLYFCRLFAIRTIVTVHDGILHPGEDNPILQYWENACLKLADHLIFLSEFVRQRTADQLILKTQSHVIPHGFLPVKGENLHRVFHRPPSLLFLGRMATYKGIDLLLDALRLLPDGAISKITFAGEVKNRLPVSDKAEQISWITRRLSPEEMGRLLAEHDILILPYREASQSGVLTLGISAAIPMVITRVGGLPEQLGPEEAIWVKTDAEDLAAGILELVNSPERWDEIHQKLLKKRLDSGWEVSVEVLNSLVLPPD